MSEPNAWSPDTPLFPHRCPLTGLGHGESNFYRTEFVYRSADLHDDRPHVLFLAEQAIRDAINAKGSPFADVNPDELARLRMTEQEQAARIAELEETVAHLGERLEREMAPVINLDGEMLAEALAKPLAKAMKNGDSPRRSRAKREPAA